jgi:hypothetical protein
MENQSVQLLIPGKINNQEIPIASLDFNFD